MSTIKFCKISRKSHVHIFPHPLSQKILPTRPPFCAHRDFAEPKQVQEEVFSLKLPANKPPSFPSNGNVKEKLALASVIKSNYLNRGALFQSTLKISWSKNALLHNVQSIKLLLLVSKAIFVVRLQNANNFLSPSLKVLSYQHFVIWMEKFIPPQMKFTHGLSVR